MFQDDRSYPANAPERVRDKLIEAGFDTPNQRGFSSCGA